MCYRSKIDAHGTFLKAGTGVPRIKELHTSHFDYKLFDSEVSRINCKEHSEEGKLSCRLWYVHIYVHL